jgi:Na+-transporting NADH:ubiquinone oxidoreductase subunit NqrE
LIYINTAWLHLTSYIVVIALDVALFQKSRDYNFIQCLVFANGSGAGLTLALIN